MIKAQTAIIEALLAALILLPAIMAVSYTSYVISDVNGGQLASFSNAFYALASIAYSNASVGSCLSQLAGRQYCSTIMNRIFSAYGVHAANIISGTIVLQAANDSCLSAYFKCLPLLKNGNYSFACIRLCGV